MQIASKPYPLPLSTKLLQVLQLEIDRSGISSDCGICIHFKDPGYSATNGGFHPVEVGISNAGRILYITDFGYVGMSPFIELGKCLDFDFQCGCFQQCGRDSPIALAGSIYRLWEQNFLAYYEIGVYRITVAEL